MDFYRTHLSPWLKAATLLGAMAALSVINAHFGKAEERKANPNELEKTPGLMLWYRADALVGLQDGAVVERWPDSGPRKITMGKHEGAPRFSSTALNGRPAVHFQEGRIDGMQTTASLPGLAGNPGFTIFLVAKLSKPKAERTHPLGWGDGSKRGGGMILEFEAGRLDLATGWSSDASTPDQSFTSHFGQPTLLTCVKSPGPMNSTSRISFNGVGQTVAGSSLVPQVQEGTLHLGGGTPLGYVSPTMDLAEILLFNRPLTLQEQNRVGFYLQQKYALPGSYIEPRQFAALDLETRVEPREIAALAGGVGQAQHMRGTSVAVAAQGRIVLRATSGTRVFAFDHWEGDVRERTSAKTTVRLDQNKAITAVYREEKREYHVARNGRDNWSGMLPQPNPAGTDGPFATLTQARNAIRHLKVGSKGQLPCPVWVYLHGGKYSFAEPLVWGPEDSGTPDCRITYTAFPGEKPIVSGGRTLTGWKPFKDRILQCQVPGIKPGSWRFRQLFYQGECQIRARTPNFDPKNPLKGGWANMEGPTEPGSQTAFRYKPATFGNRWAKPSEGEVNLFIGYDWANNIIPIKAIDEQKRTITLSHSTTRFTNPPSPLPYNFPTPFNPNQRFRMENLLEELDQPGEWCWDSSEGKLYFWPPNDTKTQSEPRTNTDKTRIKTNSILGSSVFIRGPDLESGYVVAPWLDSLVVLRQTANVTFSGLTFAETNGGDNFHHEGTEGVGAMFPMPGWKYCGDAVLLDGAQDCSIENNRFVNIGGNAIYLKGPAARNRIVGNDIGNIGACGICLAGAEAKEAYPVFNEVTDNSIHHTGNLNMYSAAIFLGLSEGNVIGHNAIRHVPHHAINLGNTGRSHNIVEYNDIRDTCLETSDTGAINCWMEHDTRNEPRQGHIIRYNLVIDSRERGIYLDNYTSNCFVFGNIIVRAPLYGLIVHGGKNNVMENNIVVGSEQAIAYYDGIDQLMPRMAYFSSGNRFCGNIVYQGKEVFFLSHKRPQRVLAQSDYNLLFEVGDAFTYLETRRREGFEMHSRIADPLFVDPARDDYRLKTGSPAFRLGFQPIDSRLIGPRLQDTRRHEDTETRRSK